METNNREPVPQAIQDVIQVTVDRAIATLIESGLLNGKLKHKKRDGKRRRSRSRSRSYTKRGKGRKRSSSSSSSSSSSDSDDEDKGKKGKGRKRSRSPSHHRGKGKERRSRTRSHSRGRHSRSRSKSMSKSRHHHGHGKKGWHRHHHDSDGLLPLYHHYFNCPCAWAEGDESGGSRKGKKHGYKAHKKHWKKFRCPFMARQQITDDDEIKDKTKDYSDKETDLSKEFETLDVIDKDKEKSQ